MNVHQVDELLPTDLILLEKHIKLGMSHLRENLSEEEVQKILNYSRLDPTTEQDLAADNTELSGNTVLVIHSTLTTLLGGWMGITGFIDFSLQSVEMLASILAFSFSFGAFIGYQNFQRIQKATRGAVEKRELQALEAVILKILKKKREEEIKKTTQELRLFLNELGVEDNRLEALSHETNVKELGEHWLHQFFASLQHHPSYKQSDIFKQAFGEMKEVETSFKANIAQHEHAHKGKRSLSSVLHKLAHSTIKIPTLLSWIRVNAKNLLLSAFPTILGTFSSLFVYIGGTPRFARELGHESIAAFFTQPHIKTIELGVAVLITLYFAYLYLHNNYKAFRRDQEIATMNIRIIQMENDLSQLEDRLLKFKSLHDVVSRTTHLFRLIKKT